MVFLNDGGGMRPADNSNWVRVYGDDSFVTKAFTYVLLKHLLMQQNMHLKNVNYFLNIYFLLL